MARNNFYLMLGLPLDPPEERTDEIQRVIDKKQHEWSRGTMDFKQGPIFREYMALLPDMKKVMLNPALRRKEAEDAVLIMTEQIRRQLAIVSKRGFVYESELIFVANKCQVSVEMVKKVCTVPVRYKEKELPGISLPAECDHFQVFLVYLQALNKIDYYDFIRQGMSYEKVRRLSTSELFNLAGKIEKEHGKYTSTESANEKICAECKRTFASEEGRRSYDEYLIWLRIQAVLEQVEIATHCTKILENEQREEALRLLCDACNSKQKAEELLQAYMEQENIRVERVTRPCMLKDEGRANPIKPNKVICQPGQEIPSRASYLYPKVVRIREEMGKNHYEEATRILKEALEQCGELPELMRIQDQLANQKKRLYSILNTINECMDQKRFYEANKHFVILKEEYPNYQNTLMETKINHGLLCGKNLFIQAEAARQEDEIISACMDAMEMCADYPGIRELLEKHPPRLNGTIHVSVDAIHHCNYIQWNDVRKEAFVRYVVMRKQDARPFHRQDGTVLASVEGNSFVDRSILPGVMYYYAVYAKRCETYSNGLCMGGVINYCEVEDAIISSKGDAIQLSWSKVPTGAKVEVYRANNFIPAHPFEGEQMLEVMAKGLIDRAVVPGNIYGYRIYTVYSRHGEKQYSSGIPLRINAGMEGYKAANLSVFGKKKVRVTYYFEVKRVFKIPYKILLHIQPDGYIRTLPPLMLVGNKEDIPHYKSTGRVIAMFPAQEMKGELIYTIRAKEIGEMRYLNLFLQREEDEADFDLLLKEGEELEIK